MTLTLHPSPFTLSLRPSPSPSPSSPPPSSPSPAPSPLTQEWLTHAKPTGYDRRGNCVPKLSAQQIKAKFRHLAKTRAVHKERHEVSCWDRPLEKCCERVGCCSEGCWDQMLGVDPDYDLRDLEEEEV